MLSKGPSHLSAFAMFLLIGCDEPALTVGNETQSFTAPATSANQISATPANVRVIDADTIALSGRKVRLNGISAAERGHPTYEAGQAFVRSVVASSSGVVCALTGDRTYDREVGTCFVVGSDGTQTNLQAAVVRAGLARDCARYSGGRYAANETAQSRALPLPGYCAL